MPGRGGAGVTRPADMLFGRRLREERLLAGMSRDALARRLGVAGEILDDYETGRTRMGPINLVAAATALGVPISFFCYEDDTRAFDVVDKDTGQTRWIAVARPLTVLSYPRFSQVRPVLKIWTETRGAWTEDAILALNIAGMLPRTFLARQTPGRSHLVAERCGYGVAFLLPCESLTMVGREIQDMPDRDYGAWMAEAHAQTASRQRPLVQSVRAVIRTSAGTALRTRYDRFLLPWRCRGDDVLVLCMSLRREEPALV